MEQIDYKEKYEQALERARQFSEKSYLEDSAGIVEYIFPELSESEDERMLKSMTRLVKAFYGCNFPTPEGFEREDMLAWLEKQSKDSPVLSNSSNTGKSSWSEEDEKISSAIIKRLKGSDALSVDLQRAICWIDHVKDRVLPQPKQEWSKEDEAFYQRLEQIVCKVDIEAFQGDIDLHSWLKSLRPQNRWRPSDEQMEALKSSTYCQNEQMSKILFELYQDLKKLMEE